MTGVEFRREHILKAVPGRVGCVRFCLHFQGGKLSKALQTDCIVLFVELELTTEVENYSKTVINHGSVLERKTFLLFGN